MPTSCAIVVHGPVGSGKTTTCLALAEMARAEGLSVAGILSPRVYQAGELVGYDGLDLWTSEGFPLVRLRSLVEGPGWFMFRQLRYAFSGPGFERANRILKRSAEGACRPSIVFVDEFGRLEAANRGLYAGASRVAEALRRGGVAVFACRGDMVDDVEGLVHGRAQVVRRKEPGDVETLWHIVKRCAVGKS